MKKKNKFKLLISFIIIVSNLLFTIITGYAADVDTPIEDASCEDASYEDSSQENTAVDTEETITTEELPEVNDEFDSDLLTDLSKDSIYAWEDHNHSMQGTLYGPDSSYWNASNYFLYAADATGKTVPAYCLQPLKASPNSSVKLTEGNSVLSPIGLQAAACSIAAFGYGGDGADPNVGLWGGTYNSEAGGSYSSYVFDGKLKRGLMINGKFYELTPQEAQAVSGASAHFFSSLAGQGNSVSAPTGSKINSAHNDNVINAFSSLTFLGLHFMNNYGSMYNVSNAVTSGSEWEKALDDYKLDFNWKIKDKNGNWISFNPQSDNNITDSKYVISSNGSEYVILKIKITSAKCSLKLIDQDYVNSMRNKGTVLTNNNKITLPDGSGKSFNYFYVSATNTCTIDYGPLYNETITQPGPGTTLTIPTFNQEATITIPVSSLEAGISLDAKTLNGKAATPIYGDGDHNGISTYSCRLFSDISSSKDYQDVLFFSPGNVISASTSGKLKGTFKYYGNLQIKKTSANTQISNNNKCYSLKGAVYCLYKSEANAKSNKNIVGKLVTGSSGYAAINNIEVGTYYMKETTAPEGYALDNTIRKVVIEKSNITGTVKTTTVNLSDKPKVDDVDIALYKTDEDDNPLGDAEFTVKYYDTISNNDPASIGLTPKRTWVLKTDSETGIAYFNEDCKVSGSSFYYSNENVVIPIGTITIEETKAPCGYELNDYIYVQSINKVTDEDIIFVYSPPVISDKKIRQSIEFNKIGEMDFDTFDALPNAGFMACPISELEQDAEGNYIWDEEKAVILTADKEKEIFTDENGCARTIPLEYGIYLFRETTVPANFLQIEDFEVNIDTSVPETKYLGSMIDESFKVYLKITKICSYSNNKIINNPASFSIWSYNDNQYVDFEGSTILRTDENGELITPLPLFPGKYRIDEVSCPEGYGIYDISEELNFEVSDNHIYEISSDNNEDKILNVNIYNKPNSGKITINKTGEAFSYYTDEDESEPEIIPLPDVTFEIYAYDDIYTIDGHNELIYAKGDLADTVTTNRDGFANTKELPFGKYIITETVTPDNYIKSEDTVIYLDKEDYILDILNKAKKYKLNLTKTSTEEHIPLEMASYAIYEYNPLYSSADEYRNSEYIEEGTTDSNGEINFESTLSYGKYAVIETSAPKGYYISEKIETIDTFDSDESESNKEISEITYADNNAKVYAPDDNTDCYYYHLAVSDSKKPDTPETGDKHFNTIFLIFIILLLFFLSLIFYKLLIYYKNHNK